jgi:heme/copper-type cytochrome/quinol oxidase subunit 4
MLINLTLLTFSGFSISIIQWRKKAVCIYSICAAFASYVHEYRFMILQSSTRFGWNKYFLFCYFVFSRLPFVTYRYFIIRESQFDKIRLLSKTSNKQRLLCFCPVFILLSLFNGNILITNNNSYTSILFVANYLK